METLDSFFAHILGNLIPVDLCFVMRFFVPETAKGKWGLLGIPKGFGLTKETELLIMKVDYKLYRKGSMVPKKYGK